MSSLAVGPLAFECRERTVGWRLSDRSCVVAAEEGKCENTVARKPGTSRAVLTASEPSRLQRQRHRQSSAKCFLQCYTWSRRCTHPAYRRGSTRSDAAEASQQLSHPPRSFVRVGSVRPLPNSCDPAARAPWEEVVGALNRTVRGRAAYFRYGVVRTRWTAPRPSSRFASVDPGHQGVSAKTAPTWPAGSKRVDRSCEAAGV
jgi:hypothetical protein